MLPFLCIIVCPWCTMSTCMFMSYSCICVNDCLFVSCPKKMIKTSSIGGLSVNLAAIYTVEANLKCPTFSKESNIVREKATFKKELAASGLGQMG